MLIWMIIWLTSISGKAQPHPDEKEIVRVSFDTTVAVPRKQGEASIRISIKSGYHIQADKVNDASLVPATLSTEQQKPFITGKAHFPPYKLFRLEGAGNYLNVFDSVFTIRLPINTRTGTKAGDYVIKAQLRYQACNERNCLFPRVLSFAMPIRVQQ